MNLVRAEIERLAARRFVQLMLVLLVAAFTVTIATTIAGSHRPTATEVAEARSEMRQQQREAARWQRECRLALNLDAPESPGGMQPRDCDAMLATEPQLTEFLPGVFIFEQQIRPLAYFLITFLALFGFLVGASYIGADLNSGGMTNLLLWRPRRLTVLGTKLGTLLAGVLGLSVAATLVYLGAFWLVARARGQIGTLDVDFWAALSQTLGRGWVLMLMVTALGFAVATLGRHTAAALGVLAAYGVVWEAGGRIVMEIVDASRPDMWMLSTYVGAWLNGQARFWSGPGICQNDGYRVACDGSEYIVGWPLALVVLLAVVSAFVGSAFATFRRRDLA